MTAVKKKQTAAKQSNRAFVKTKRSGGWGNFVRASEPAAACRLVEAWADTGQRRSSSAVV